MAVCCSRALSTGCPRDKAGYRKSALPSSCLQHSSHGAFTSLVLFERTMATSSERGTSRAPPTPPPEELAAFYALAEKKTAAAVLSRHARCAEMCDRAAKLAERLYGDTHNSLVVAELRVSEATHTRCLAFATTSFSERMALLRRAWAILLPVHALLLRRLADNTLLPGTNKELEAAYYARLQAFTLKAQGKPAPPKEY